MEKKIEYKNSPKISIITVNWNGKEDTLACLDSLMDINYPNYDIIVVDNASTDGSVDYLKEKYPEIIYLENEINSGWTGGNNTGMKYATKNGADYCLLSNNDIILDKNCLKELILIAKSDKRIGFTAPKVYYYDNPPKIYSAGLDMIYPLLLPKKLKKGKMDRGQFNKVEEVNWVDDIVLLVSKELIEKVGMYDEDYFMYVEETDWCYRAKKEGFKFIFVPSAIAWHKAHASSGGGYINPFIAYYKTRNRILFVRRHFPKYCLVGIAIHISGFILFHSLKALFTGKINVIPAMIKGVGWHLKHINLE